MRAFYWIMMQHGRKTWPLGFRVREEAAQAEVDRLNAHVAFIGGEMTYSVRSDEGNAQNILGPATN